MGELIKGPTCIRSLRAANHYIFYSILLYSILDQKLKFPI